jgi:hypothetical protein
MLTPLPPHPSLYILLLVSAAFRTAQSVRPNSTYGIVEGAPPLTVRCDSSDSAVDAYDWSKDGRPINSSTIPGLTISGGSITISSANHTLHNGSYSCAINGSDDLEEEFTVFVYYIRSEVNTLFPLHRTYQECAPDIEKAYIKASLTLDCLAPDGYPPVDIRWFLLQTELTSATSEVEITEGGRRLIREPLSTLHSGPYWCEASNEAGNRRSEELYITVTVHGQETPEISILDADTPLVVGLGQRADLVCRIFPPVDVNDVVWQLNTNVFNSSDGRRRTVQRSHPEQTCITTLHVDSSTAQDQGTYECHAEGSTGDQHAQRLLLLAVLEGPLVVEATPTKLLAAGRSLTLTCRLSDVTDPTKNNVSPDNFKYRWTHNGSSGSVGGERELVISPVSVGDSGTYLCSVNSSSVPTAISASIDVTVEVPPRVTISLLGSDSVFDRIDGTTIYVQLGARVTLQCKISSTRPTNFTWFRKEVDEVFSMSSSASLSSTLTLSHLTPSLLTSYSCHASNLVHDNLVSEERTLRETEMSYVRDAAAGIKGVKFRNGTTLELVCEARGESVERLVWRRGDEQLTNQMTAAGSSLTIATNGNNSTLTIVGVTTKEAGLIECALIGTASKLVYNVTITVPAQIEYTSRPFVTVTIGDEVRFDCVASGIPPPTIKWLFDTQPVEEVEDLEDLGNGSLRISSVTRDHQGSYHCFLALENGQLSQEFTLTVEDRAEEDSLLCGREFTRGDCVTLLSGGSVAVFLLVLTLLVLLFCFCILCRRWSRGAYEYPREFEMKRAFSSRASSHKDGGAAPVFDDVNGFAEPQGFRNGLYPVHPPLATFDRAAAVSELQRSVTPPAPSPVLQTPGTGGTDSMFSSDDQSSLTATLPNYPRAKLTLGADLGEGEFGPVVLGVARNIVSHEETTQVRPHPLVGVASSVSPFHSAGGGEGVGTEWGRRGPVSARPGTGGLCQPNED